MNAAPDPGPRTSGTPHGAPATRLVKVLHFGPARSVSESYLLGLLSKIKCSICSYQLNLWYVAHGVT